MFLARYKLGKKYRAFNAKLKPKMLNSSQKCRAYPKNAEPPKAKNANLKPKTSS